VRAPTLEPIRPAAEETQEHDSPTHRDVLTHHPTRSEHLLCKARRPRRVGPAHRRRSSRWPSRDAPGRARSPSGWALTTRAAGSAGLRTLPSSRAFSPGPATPAAT